MGKMTWLGFIVAIVLIVVAAVLCIKFIPGAHEWVTDLFSPAEQTEQTEDDNTEQTEDNTDTETTLTLTKGGINYEFSY